MKDIVGLDRVTFVSSVCVFDEILPKGIIVRTCSFLEL